MEKPSIEPAPRRPRIAAILRKVPVDLAAFLTIALVLVVTHRPYIRLGMCFNDASWYFHFGKRLLDGDVPFRDYLFQVGPLPIYVDAGFQEIFGTKYVASLYAALFIKILRVFVVWAIARRLAGVGAAAGLAVFCAFDPMFAFVYHWSTPYAELFITLSGLCFVLAARAEGRAALVRLFAAGVCAGLVVTARQSTAVMIAMVGIVATGILLYRREYFTRRRFVMLWAGFAAAFVILFGALAVQGALGPAIQQMFLDAPAKKSVSVFDAIADALTGGALLHQRFDLTFAWWSSLLVFIGLPAAIIGGALYLSSRSKPLSPQAAGTLVLPIVMIIGLLTRHLQLGFFTDLPRTFLSVTTALAVLAPHRLRAWFGLEPLTAIGLGALPLASDWALELSNLGRGWGDPSALIVGVILLSLASSRITQRTKAIVSAGFALAGLVHLASSKRQDYNAYGNDGTLLETRYSLRHPMLVWMRVNEGRRKVFDWLRAEVRPGSTCFIYGNLPVVYTLLDCRNPTRIDSAAADFMTAGDADEAIAILHANPPEFIIAHDRAWMSPPLRVDLGGKLENYSGLNPAASMRLHVGLRKILDQYEDIGFAADIIGPELVKITQDKWDIIDQVRLYRRKSL